MGKYQNDIIVMNASNQSLSVIIGYGCTLLPLSGLLDNKETQTYLMMAVLP